jgi:hypothetical protein
MQDLLLAIEGRWSITARQVALTMLARTVSRAMEPHQRGIPPCASILMPTAFLIWVSACLAITVRDTVSIPAGPIILHRNHSDAVKIATQHVEVGIINKAPRGRFFLKRIVNHRADSKEN